MRSRLFIFLLLVVSGCVKEVDLALPSPSRRVVIEGQLSDANTGNYVRLVWSDPERVELEYEEPIRDALVIIRDDLNQTDTLEMTTVDRFSPFEGYYLAKKLKCAAGRTYFLTVKVGSDIFTAQAFMPPVPQIDSVIVQYVKDTRSGDGKFSGYQPLMYFTDPPSAENFYLTKLCFKAKRPDWLHFEPSMGCGLGNRVWNYSVLSDELLKEVAKGININVGSTPSSYYIQNLEEGNYEAQLYSLTREAYKFYYVLVSSFENDGGAYSPTPSSAPSNIRGGALGFFNASAVATLEFSVQ